MMKMKYLKYPLIQFILVLVNVPGALDGHIASILGVAICSAFFGFSVGLAIQSRDSDILHAELMEQLRSKR